MVEVTFLLLKQYSEMGSDCWLENILKWRQNAFVESRATRGTARERPLGVIISGLMDCSKIGSSRRASFALSRRYYEQSRKSCWPAERDGVCFCGQCACANRRQGHMQTKGVPGHFIPLPGIALIPVNKAAACVVAAPWPLLSTRSGRRQSAGTRAQGAGRSRRRVRLRLTRSGQSDQPLSY